MRIGLALAVLCLAGCGSTEKPTPAPAQTVAEPKITQLYAPNQSIAAGEKATICYGVENAKSVWIAPAGGGARQELSAALARCIEVAPTANTTYTLTAESAEGKRVTQDVTIGIGPPKARITNVNVSAVEVKAGDTVTVCYTVANARSVTIDPPGYKGGSNPRGCATDQPTRTTTYVVAVTGAAGERDEERVTVRVR
jgi:hypothetical protein